MRPTRALVLGQAALFALAAIGRGAEAEPYVVLAEEPKPVNKAQEIMQDLYPVKKRARKEANRMTNADKDRLEAAEAKRRRKAEKNKRHDLL